MVNIVVPAFGIGNPHMEGGFIEGFTKDICDLLNRVVGINAVPLFYQGDIIEGENTSLQDVINPAKRGNILLLEKPSGKILEYSIKNLKADYVISGIIDLSLEDCGIEFDLINNSKEVILKSKYLLKKEDIWAIRYTILEEILNKLSIKIDNFYFCGKNFGTTNFNALYYFYLSKQEKINKDIKIQLLEDSIREDHKFVEALMRLANILIVQNLKDRAYNIISNIVKNYPDYPDALLLWGNILSDKGNYEDAEFYLKKALENRPDGIVNYSLALHLDRVGKHNEAIPYYKKAIELGLKDAYLHEKFGIVLASVGKIDDAIKEWQTALEIDPDRGLCYSNLALAYYRKGLKDKAFSYFEKAVEYSGDHYIVFFNFGVFLQESGNALEAIKAYEKAIALKPDYAMAYNNMGLCLMKLNRLDEAKEYFQKAILLDKTGEAGKNAEKNLEQFENILEENRLAEMTKRGRELILKGKESEGIDILREVVTYRPVYWPAWLFIGIGYRQKKRKKLAIEAFERVLMIDPNNVDANSELGILYSEAGELEKAIKYSKIAFDLKPDDPVIICNHSMILINNGNLDEAESLLNKAKLENPDNPLIDNCIKELNKYKKRTDGKWWKI